MTRLVDIRMTYIHESFFYEFRKKDRLNVKGAFAPLQDPCCSVIIVHYIFFWKGWIYLEILQRFP